MTKLNPRVRLFARAAALAAVVTCVAACSSDVSTSSSLQDTLAPVSSTTLGSTVDPNATTTVVTTPVTIDANAALQGGLAALANGYHFVSTVTVNGTPSLTAEGDRIGDSSSLVLSGEGGTVSYIVTPDGSYAQPEGGDWSLLDVAPATSDPIAALLAPVAVVAIPTTDGSVAVQATVTATALGINAEGNVDVQVVLVNGAISQITYSAAVEGGTAQVVSIITPLVDSTPIVAPI